MLFVISSPSGAGKTTLTHRLRADYLDTQLSISVTTRAPRANEEEDRDYFFRSETEFNEMLRRDEFLEHAKVHGHFYGTPRKAVEEAVAKGFDVLFDIDWQGAQQLSQSVGKDVVKIFILPPSLKSLEKRLRRRAMDSDDVIRKRLQKAENEITHWAEYDYVLINENLDWCYAQLVTILTSERLRRYRQMGLTEHIEALMLEFVAGKADG